MPNTRRRWFLLVLLGLIPALASLPSRAQEDAPASAPAEAETDAEDKTPLEQDQDILAQRFRQFEDNMQRMQRYLEKVQPEQAEILRRTYDRSKEQQVRQRMEVIVALLETRQFGNALERQEDVIAELKTLLKLLESGEELDKNRLEQKRIEDLIRDITRIERNQRTNRADVERGGDPIELADKQERIKQQTQDLIDKIDGQDAARAAENGQPGEGKPGEGKPGEGKPGEGEPGEGKPGEGEPGKGEPGEGMPGEGKPGEGKPGEGMPGEGMPGEGKPGEGKPGEGMPGEGKPGEGKPGEGMPGEGMPGEGMPGEGMPGEGMPGEGKPGEGKPGEGKPGEGMPGEGMPGEGQPGEGQPGEGQPGEGQPGEGQPGDENPDKTPGRDNIEQAKKEMERAIEELKRRERDAASRNQDKALEELAKAREKLEEILRQLREEEKKLLLAALRSRFERMLEMQRAVTRGTIQLSVVKEFGTVEIGRSARLSGDEADIAVEADKALNILKEEGSSVAFPEAVEQIREDILLVARRLNPQMPEDDPKADVGEVTIAIEKDIEEALAELVEALEKELEKLKKKEGEPPPPMEGEPPDPALVDKLAELKMLRSLQKRVNRRTKLLGRQVDGEQAMTDDILEQLQGLGRRQAAIQRAAYDLATGRNQ